MEIAISVFLVIILLTTLIRKNISNTDPTSKTDQENNNNKESELPINGYYQPKWLFSYNEKDAFKKLKIISEKYGLTLLAKVRLFDLVEPIKNNPKYKTYQYKIQSKHVDFVLCDKKLVAKCIIELDGTSHDTSERKTRDEFIDKVLISTGYRILRIKGVDIEKIEQQVAEIFLYPNKTKSPPA